MHDIIMIADPGIPEWLWGVMWSYQERLIYRQEFLEWESGLRPKGIDLGERGHEVRKLLYAGFSGLMQSQRYDPEDVLQEVYRGLLTRNRGKCPWDSRKSTFGHYVHMVISCVLRNYHRKEQTRLTKLPCVTDEVDIESVSHDDLPLADLLEYLRRQGGPLLDPALRCLPMVVQGHTQEQMALTLGISKHVISKSVQWIRSCAISWSG